MPAYSLTLVTVCNFSYSLPVPTVGQATVNPNPSINIGELIGSPEQLLMLPHMDAKDPGGDTFLSLLRWQTEGEMSSTVLLRLRGYSFLFTRRYQAFSW